MGLLGWGEWRKPGTSIRKIGLKQWKSNSGNEHGDDEEGHY
jgi:hypothetical protein